MAKPKICVVTTDGTNCDKETRYAFNKVGGDAEIVRIKSLIRKYDPVESKKISLSDYDILAIPGGFSYGDYIASGKIFAIDLKDRLGEEVLRFIEAGKPVIGICNGFQVLVKSGLLPMIDGNTEQTTTLTYNNSLHFECDWVKLVQPRKGKCLWTRGIESIDIPVAHGEGRFVAPNDLVMKLFDSGQVVFQYADDIYMITNDYPHNPNGSIQSIAGI